MEVSFKGSVSEFRSIFSPIFGSPLVGLDPLPDPLPPPPTTPDAGDYVKGTTVAVSGGITTYTDVLYKLPDPGGDIGWNGTTRAFYVV